MENLDDALRLVAEMRAGLEGVADGDWILGRLASWDTEGRPVRFVYRPGDSHLTRIMVAGGEGEDGSSFNCDADAAHIFRCQPKNIRLLLDTIDTLRRERDEAREERDAEFARFDMVRVQRDGHAATIAAQAAEIEGLKEIIAAGDKGSPVYAAVERILDEHSAWISRPSRKVTSAVALASAIACDVAFGAEMRKALDECDDLRATVERLKAEIARKDAALTEVVGCFDAAYVEGLQEQLAEHEPEVGSLRDLVERRLLFAHNAARAALQPTETPATVADQEPVAQRIEHAEPDEGRQDAGSTPAGFATPTLTQSGAGEPVVKALVTSAMVNAAWNEGKTRRMTGLPNDFRAVLEAALSPSPPQEPTR